VLALPVIVILPLLKARPLITSLLPVTEIPRFAPHTVSSAKSAAAGPVVVVKTVVVFGAIVVPSLVLVEVLLVTVV